MNTECNKCNRVMYVECDDDLRICDKCFGDAPEATAVASLKPCKCGGNGIYHTVRMDGAQTIECDRCLFSTITSKYKNKLIAAWNTRLEQGEKG